GMPARDEIGDTHPGTFYGSVEHGVAGIVPENGAARFDGTTGCIGVGEYFRFPGRAAFSVEGWVNLSEYGSEGTRMVSTEGYPTGIRSGWNLSASYGDNTGYPYFDAWSSEGTDNQYVTGAYASTSPDEGKLPLGEWSHVVGTFDDEAEEIWVNGVLRNRVRQSTLNHPDAGTLTIGCAGSGSGPIYLGAKGALDEIAIYDKVLSPERIAAHYAAGR
ncbi:MAG: LamG domain-containing protein, partial [Proteobacteria bacterium]